MNEENKGFDFTGLSADEDFDSFLESIRRDLDGTPAPASRRTHGGGGQAGTG